MRAGQRRRDIHLIRPAITAASSLSAGVPAVRKWHCHDPHWAAGTVSVHFTWLPAIPEAFSSVTRKELTGD
jgi:hypothetical protein